MDISNNHTNFIPKNEKIFISTRGPRGAEVNCNQTNITILLKIPKVYIKIFGKNWKWSHE